MILYKYKKKIVLFIFITDQIFVILLLGFSYEKYELNLLEIIRYFL